MPTVEIQVDPNDPAQSTTVELLGLEYVFDFWYYERPDAWYFDLYLVDGTPLLQGEKVVLNFPLYQPSEDSRLPQGLLMALAADGSTRRPTLGELGARVYLAFIDPADVEAPTEAEEFLADLQLA